MINDRAGSFDCDDLRCLVQPRQNLAKTIEVRLQVLNDLFRQLVRLGQIVGIGKAFVPQPENIEAGFIAGDQIVIGVSAPIWRPAPQQHTARHPLRWRNRRRDCRQPC
jgi:hypothetical protein